MSLSKQVIAEIIKLKETTGLSQSELSRRTGIPQKTISRMENGLSTPTLESLDKICSALGYNLTFNIIKRGND